MEWSTVGWERHLWVLAILLYGIADPATTMVGLSTGGVAEAGPIAGPAIDRFGFAGLWGVKIALFGMFAGIWAGLDTPGRMAVPAALAVVGVVVTAWNVLVIATAM